jgi:ferritin-like metal-binding protein YciE
LAEVESARELLVMAIADLHDGEQAMAERLGKVRDHTADEAMRTLIAQDARESEARRGSLAAMARGLDAEPGDATNIWLRAILDDADNDAATIARGPWRDVALGGALRKGKQAQRVSYETALALARRLDLGNAVEALAEMIEAAAATDAALARALRRLCKTAATG